MQVFLDANVLFTACHNPFGRAAEIANLARLGACKLVTSTHAIEEARRNLARKYPIVLSRLDDLLADVTVYVECSREKIAWARSQLLPDKDAPILAAAAQNGADLLITGDRAHFGHLYGKSPGGVRVVTPAQGLAIILENWSA